MKTDGKYQPVTYVWEIWDLDDTFKELHFSGSVEELREAADENTDYRLFNQYLF